MLCAIANQRFARKETSHVTEGAFVSLCGKAEPMLPGIFNGQLFVNDGVLSVPLTTLCGGRSSATLTLKYECQGRFTLLDDLRLRRDIKAHWAGQHLQVLRYLPDSTSSVINILTTLTSARHFAQQSFC